MRDGAEQRVHIAGSEIRDIDPLDVHAEEERIPGTVPMTVLSFEPPVRNGLAAAILIGIMIRVRVRNDAVRQQHESGAVGLDIGLIRLDPVQPECLIGGKRPAGTIIRIRDFPIALAAGVESVADPGLLAADQVIFIGGTGQVLRNEIPAVGVRPSPPRADTTNSSQESGVLCAASVAPLRGGNHSPLQ